MVQSYKTFQSGTHRVVSPAQTYQRVAHYASQMGITRLANITGLDTLGLHVYMAVRPNSRSLAVSQGKGVSKDAAKVSALMESIESYHAERINLPVKILSFNDLAHSHKVINIDLLSKLSPVSFHYDTRIPWLEGIDLFTQEKKWLPYECVSTDYTHPQTYNQGHFIADTNGLASGNTFDEAINHGLYEVIERDALALWTLSDAKFKQSRKVDIQSIPIPFIENTLKNVKASGAHIGVWDITTDIGIPSFICKIVQDPSDFRLGIRPSYGSGTHLSKEIAVLRAITEAAQSRLTFIAGSRDDQYISVYDEQNSLEKNKKWYAEITQKASHDFASILEFRTDDIKEDAALILDRLRLVYVEEAIVINLTLEQFQIPVVKVVVPGLEGISYSGRRIMGARGIHAYKKGKADE